MASGSTVMLSLRLQAAVRIARCRGPQNVGFAARNDLHRRRCASAILALPSAVLGPVDNPPWNRQRRFPGTTLMMQAAPARVLAPHLGRNLRRLSMNQPDWNSDWCSGLLAPNTNHIRQ